MPRISSVTIPDADSPFSHGKLKENTVYGKAGETIGEVMARVANAPIRETVIEMDVVSAYPATHRRSTLIPETSKKRRRVIHSDSPVPMLVSNNHTDDYLCGLMPMHTHPTPDWLIHPNNYRCECGRYCSDAFLVNGLCGYCRGEY